MDPSKLESLRNVSLLYVEDDPATREELAQILEVWLGDVSVATNGQEGLDAYQARRPDIVLTDIQMPILNGLSMSAEIRKSAPEQPILVLSAYNDMEFLFRAIDLGISNYITKPVSVEKLLGKLSDLAEQQEAARQQRRDRKLLEQYRTLVDESAVVAKFDRGGRVVYANAKFSELSGYSEMALARMNVRELTHPDESQDISGTIWRTVLAGEKWTGIVKNAKHNGDMYVVERNLVPIVDENDEITEIVGLDVDITQIYLNYEAIMAALDRSELSLREQRHYLNEYKRALELGTCICIADAAGTIVGVNRQFADILGYPPEALRGRRLEDIVPDGGNILAEAARADDADTAIPVARLRRGDSSEITLSAVLVAVRDLDGCIDSVILVCLDIAETLRFARAIVEAGRDKGLTPDGARDARD